MSFGRAAYALPALFAWAAAAHADPPSTNVRLEANVPAVLQVRDADTARWIDVCATPCDQTLDVVPEYRVTGADLRSTPPFSVRTSERTQRIFAAMAPSGRRSAGIVSLAAGVPSAILGTALSVVLVFVPPMLSCPFAAPDCTPQSNPVFPLTVVSAVFFHLLGAVLLGEGGSLLARSRSTVTVQF